MQWSSGSGAAEPWFLGEAVSAARREGALALTASASGTHRYRCSVPGHAQDGVAGTSIVRSRS